MLRFYTFLLLGLCCLLGGHSLHAQLNPSDIMFVGFRFDGTSGDLGCEDGFAFAALVDIPANTTVYFTEDEYNGTAFGTDGGTISWTNTALTPAGTVVALTTHVQTNADFCNGTNPGPTANFGTIQFETNMGTQPWNIGISNQEIYAYLGAPLMPTTWLCAMYTDNLDNSNTPPAELSGLILDFSNVDQDADMGMYTGTLDCADRNACLANILNLANWTTENEPGVSDCCDDNGVDYPGDLPDGFFQCEQPVINGVNLIGCVGNNNLQLEVDGELNGAAQWDWLQLNEICEGGFAFATGMQVTSDYLSAPNGTMAIVRASGGCLNEPVCFTFVPSDLVANAIGGLAFTAPGGLIYSSDLPIALTGGMPAGGTYSGTGVVDNGDGTYSFDPSVGAGTYTITYSYTDPDGTNCTASVADDIVVESCEQPVINGVNLISCDGGNFYTLEVDGELNGAARWEWTGPPSFQDFPCDQQNILEVNAQFQIFNNAPSLTLYVRAAGGCLEEPICFGYTINDLLSQGLSISFTAPGPFNTTDGIQALTTGMPAGGIYSGTGVVGNGDGTYSFDPSVGAGTYTITYTYTDPDGTNCTASVADDIVVESCIAPVINGVNIVDCGTDFSGVTLEVDGELNGAAQWEWTGASFGNIPCEELDVFVTGTTLSGAGFTAPDSTYYIRAAGGCLDAPVCLAYTPNEILGAPNIGGTVALADGTTDISFCIEIDGTNELSFAATGNAGDNFTFLITDQSNNIEAFDNTGIFDFATLDDGTYRIWGLSYSGNLLLGVGDNPVSDPVSDKCSDLSDNFISVRSKIANAGSIGVIGAGAENDVCVGDGINDNYSFLFQGSEGSSPFFSSYALTDDNDALLQFPISSPFNFETLPAGNYRVRTVLYTGSLTLNLGDNLTTTPISNDCYDFSGNFIAFNLSAVPTVTFTAPGPFAPNAGIQALTGGMPEGGTYSGPGVINNGDGTYSFDPSIGLGSYTITFTFEVAACNTAASTTDIIVVQEVFLPGDMCMDAIDINTQFGQTPGEVQSSGPYDNTNATTDDSDPDFGWECFGEPDGGGSAPSLERTLWYTFEGDGNNYFIEALACGDDPIDFGDTQFVIYEGPSCDSLEAVLCSEDGPNVMPGGPFPAGDTLQTEAGVTYYIMVDGFGPDFAADGEFCLEVTNLTVPVVPAMVTFQVDASRLVEAGTLAPEGIFISGEFNGFPDPGTPMVEGADNVWSITLEFPESDTFEYKFQNGPGGWEDIDESIGDPCTLGDFGNRFVVVEETDVTTDLVCFNYCVTCDMVVGIDEQTLQASIEVFPNPVRDILNVQVDLPSAAESLHLRLMNTLGQVVLSNNYGQLQSGNIELDMSQLPAGTYLLQVRDGRAQFARSVVVQR
ncbi:MAG: T9SS type A sorting domain-containing protein [Phaeodactylibacter sp.]|uniref:T9SS type A sorting domain-containing protein n=1 Tax=Phaeodactylibacter sp. TaxID=1940289 RepID=UPI0032EF2EF9